MENLSISRELLSELIEAFDLEFKVDDGEIVEFRIKEKFPEKTLAVFVKPPSLEIMEKRLRSRETETEEKIQERLAKAEKELSYAEQFDIILVNDDLDTAKEEAENLVRKFTS